MMSKELLKKAGILGVTFGLMASPFAFAQEPANPSGNISPDQEPMETQSTGAGTDSATYDQNELIHEEGDAATDLQGSMNSTSSSASDNEAMGSGPTGETSGGDTSFESDDLPKENSSVTTDQ
ncbi:hypothetical protein [Vreelandella populi]|uniref:Uncharacterized protein n=1 Tax=Vreelandella populi TaxID=2498858 RepID=A0A433LF23_9GAMM|nr:hypothetical protein [Halomonas populi]RUR35695.1 hypothetical protein ELY25_17055 [Halomonas populi]RUR47886.1 hypothetical protein ELY37_06410 [Halomonas populi]